MLSIEEIKLLIEKLEKIKKEDFQKLIDTNLKILKDIEIAVDANNRQQIIDLDKPVWWYKKDLEYKSKKPNVSPWLYRMVQTKIQQFSKSHLFNSLEIGPGNGIFSKEFRSWRLNFFLDILPELEVRIRRRFNPVHQKKYVKFYWYRC